VTSLPAHDRALADPSPSALRIAIYHNIMWSRYKAGVFSRLHVIATETGRSVDFIQIAETEGDRAVLSGVDESVHRYPYTLLFKGAYGAVPTWRRCAALLRDLARRRPDFVVMPGFDRAEYWAMLVYCMLTRTPRAVFCDSTIHDRPRAGWKERAKRWFFSHCDGVFCYGRRSREYVMSYDVPEARIFRRVQAAALPADHSDEQVLRHHESNPVDPDRPSFLFVGRLSHEKGLPDLVAAFARVRAELPRARLTLVGAGPLRASLERQAVALDVAEGIDFLGGRDAGQIVPLYLSHAALVLPSHSEPWGLVVNEALAHGLPVVVSDVCGCVPELVVDGVTGWSFPVGQVDALATAMSKAARMGEHRVDAARACLQAIASYVPDEAARQILQGCESIDRLARAR